MEDFARDHDTAFERGDGDRHHPLADRWPSILRHHLGHHGRRPRLHERRDRVRDLQGIPGRLLWSLVRWERRAVPRGHGDHGSACVRAQQKAGGTVTRVRVRAWTTGVIAIVVSIVVFLVPFMFVILQSSKTPADASSLTFTWPKHWQFLSNLRAVLQTNDGIIWRAFFNSAILTVTSVTIMVILAAMAGYVLGRRKSKWNALINFFGTLQGMILIEAPFGLSFSILLFRAFVGNIPRELDEAAVLDGAGPFRLFFQVVLPLLRPVVVTVVVVQAVFVFNDFAGPLYFLPGNEHATVQLTLFTFQGQNLSFYNLLFMDILLITIPPLIAYIFSNRQIVAGITSGAIKG